MNRRVLVATAAVAILAPVLARAQEAPTVELSAEDLELARYLELLEELELLESWDLLELMPLLEDLDED